MGQTAGAFELVSRVAENDDFTAFCTSAARRRRHLVEVLEAALGHEARRHLVAHLGRLHRTWIRFIATAGDAVLADELDRLDSVLERAVRRTRHIGTAGTSPEVPELLMTLRSTVEAMRDDLLARRADLDWGGESLPALGHDRLGRRRDGPTRREESTGHLSHGRWQLPDLSAVSARGTPVDLDEVAGESPIVLTFIPKLNRRSRKRLGGFNRRLREFEVRDTQLVGVAKARPQQLQRMAHAEDLDMPLLADPEGELAEAIDAVDGSGRPMNSTMLIDREREVLFVSLSAGREAHAGRILQAVDRYREWFPQKMGVAADSH